MIYPGDLVMLKSNLLGDGECFKVGRAKLQASDILRCIATDGDVRLFVSRRTGANFPFSLETLRTKFNMIGFDGLEEIT